MRIAQKRFDAIVQCGNCCGGSSRALSKVGSSAEFVQVIRFRKISKVMQQSEFRDA
jgi:hypothetical protein